MSTLLNHVRALRPPSLPRPRLTIVPKVAAKAPRIPFVLLVVTVLSVGLIGLLLLNTALQRGAYQATDLRATSAELALQQERLGGQVAALQQPQNLAQRAVRMGMVRGDNPAFLYLETGKVVGVAAPAVAANRVDIGGTPPVGMGATPYEAGTGKIGEPVAGQLSSGVTGIVVHKPERPERSSDRDRNGSDDEGAPANDRANNSTDTDRTSGDER